MPLRLVWNRLISSNGVIHSSIVKVRHILYLCLERYPRSLVAKLLNYNIVQNEFEFTPCDYVHFQTNTFGKGMNPLISAID